MIADATSTTTATTASAQYRWVEERIVHKWMSEGSIQVGEWPQSMQDKHHHDLHTIRSRLENERDKLIAQNTEVANQFQAYKIRAQTALKRIGTEDRQEKQRVNEQESIEIERLKNIINDYKDKENELMMELGAKDMVVVEKDADRGRLLSQIEVLETTILDNEQKLQILERKITLQQKEIETLHDENKSLGEQYEAAEKSHRERLRALQQRQRTANSDFMMLDDDTNSYQSNNAYSLNNSNNSNGSHNQSIVANNNNTSVSSQPPHPTSIPSTSSVHSSDLTTINNTTEIHVSSSSSSSSLPALKRDDFSIEAVIAEPIDEVIDNTSNSNMHINMHSSSSKLLLFKQVPHRLVYIEFHRDGKCCYQLYIKLINHDVSYA